MVKNVYKVDICFDINILLKNYKEKQIDDIITIALWSIYKMLILRNEYGKEEREKRLWFTFLKELKLRIDINNALMKKKKCIICLLLWKCIFNCFVNMIGKVRFLLK